MLNYEALIPNRIENDQPFSNGNYWFPNLDSEHKLHDLAPSGR